MLAEGDIAPDFTLNDQAGNPVTLSGLRGGPVVLYFYPKDSSPGCTIEACSFRNAWDDFKTAGATILGISPDGMKAHLRFASRHRLPFRLLDDPDRETLRAYNALFEKTILGLTLRAGTRATFIIDGDGVIRKIFRKVNILGHSNAVLDAIRACG